MSDNVGICGLSSHQDSVYLPTAGTCSRSSPGEPPQLKYLEIEWKVREALGEEHVPLDAINVNFTRMLSRLLFGYICDRLSLSSRTVNLLICEAEQMTVAESFDPI